jgi:hypothetical protein
MAIGKSETLPSLKTDPLVKAFSLPDACLLFVAKKPPDLLDAVSGHLARIA